MGTRHATIVIAGGKNKIAQYGQWDGYPDGQGLTVLNFLTVEGNIERLKAGIKKVRFATKKDEKDKEVFFKEMGCEDGWMNMTQAEAFKDKYPLLSRDVGAEILEAVSSLEDEAFLVDSSDFVNDGLFCEWAWEVNLDKGTLRELQNGEVTFQLDALPNEKEFLAAFATEEEDDY